MTAKVGAKTKIDVEKFRLRRFVDRLIEMNEVEIHDEPVPLTALGAMIEQTDKALLFRNAGPERLEIVAKTAGNPKRLAAGTATQRKRRRAQKGGHAAALLYLVSRGGRAYFLRVRAPIDAGSVPGIATSTSNKSWRTGLRSVAASLATNV